MKYIKSFMKTLFLISATIAALCWGIVWIGMLMRPGVLEGMLQFVAVGALCVLFIKWIKNRPVKAKATIQ